MIAVCVTYTSQPPLAPLAARDRGTDSQYGTTHPAAYESEVTDTATGYAELVRLGEEYDSLGVDAWVWIGHDGPQTAGQWKWFGVRGPRGEWQSDESRRHDATRIKLHQDRAAKLERERAAKCRPTNGAYP